jgi:hypothetical protein
MLDLRDLVAVADEERFDITALAGKYNIVAARFGERRRAFDLEGNILFREVPPEGKLHHRSSHHAPQMLVR